MKQNTHDRFELINNEFIFQYFMQYFIFQFSPLDLREILPQNVNYIKFQKILNYLHAVNILLLAQSSV